MSTDKAVTKDLMQVLADGREGFSKGAEKLDGSNPDIASTFQRLSSQRAAFYSELEEIANDYGDDVEESGSALGTLHRGWMSLKDALSGSSAKGVVEAAEQGEDHAVEAYKKALSADISAELRSAVERQQRDVQAAHDAIRSLKASFSNA
jgi:uncharacterized protein (TIGR02284 family)